MDSTYERSPWLSARARPHSMSWEAAPKRRWVGAVQRLARTWNYVGMCTEMGGF